MTVLSQEVDHFTLTELKSTRMKNILYKSIFILGLVWATSGVAQIEPMYGMYRFNANAINPAQAGSSKQMDVALLSRWQWSTLEGAPKTHVASFSTPYRENVGFAVNMVSDNIGPVSDFYLGADYAYQIPISNETKLSGGIRLSVINHRVNLANRNIIDQTDEAFKYNLNSGFRVNPGLGFLLINPKYYVGFSMPRILRYSFGDQFNISTYKDVQHTFLYAGFEKELNRDITLRPSFISNFAVNSPLSIDVNVTASVFDRFDIGLMYRIQDAIGLVTGYRFTNGLYLGYSYEYPISQMRRVTRMSNEFALRFTFDDFREKKILTPRYFN